jgi:hexokinase
LFDFIAVELGKFVEAHPNSKKTDTPAKYNKLGFIVSCPVDQAVASSGTAITWKSFSADSTVEFIYMQLPLHFSFFTYTS